jgi:ADP-ribose pyrophosphatase YjhB (NUDIX family)
MIASRSAMDMAAVMESLTMQAGYITPKIDVRGAVLQDGKILLVQERSDSRWAMPGGWADLGDAPAAMVAREVLEESGLQVRPTKVVGILDANRIQPFEFYHAYKIIFLCEIQGGDLRASLETLNAAFFDRAALPELSAYRTSEAMIREAFAHAEDPTRSTFFD